MDKENDMRIDKNGNVVAEFGKDTRFTLRTPPWPSVRTSGEKTIVEFGPDTLLHIAEVSALTGYTVNTLRQLDGKEIPASKRLDDGTRAWTAKETFEIRERRRKLHGIG